MASQADQDKLQLLQKSKQELQKQVDDLKKRDFDLSAANKILKKQSESAKIQLKTKDKDVESVKEKYEKMINELITNSKLDKEKLERQHLRKVESLELSKTKAIKEVDFLKNQLDN